MTINEVKDLTADDLEIDEMVYEPSDIAAEAVEAVSAHFADSDDLGILRGVNEAFHHVVASYRHGNILAGGGSGRNPESEAWSAIEIVQDLLNQ